MYHSAVRLWRKLLLTRLRQCVVIGAMNKIFYNTPQHIGSMSGMTPSVRFLLILNISIFLIERILRFPFTGFFALPAIWWETLSFGRLFTYMFVHGSFNHLFVNMLGLFFIGSTVERTIGSYRFFILYYLSGILGGLGWSLLAPAGSVCVGASGGVMGILGAFGALYPSARLLLWFFFPVRAWVLVVVLILWELSETIHAPRIGGIANAAHLIGAIAGVFYALGLKYPDGLNSLKIWQTKQRRKNRVMPGEQPVSSAEINRILDKIGREGMGALSASERAALQQATRR